MNYDEFKDLCRKSWEEDSNYLYIDRSKKRNQGKYCICNESKKTYRSNTSNKTFLKQSKHGYIQLYEYILQIYYEYDYFFKSFK